MINIKELIKDALTKFWAGCKKNVVNNLTSTSTDLPLSANMGKSLNDSKQAKITGAATTVTSNNLTASRVLVSDKNGKIAASSIGSSDIVTKSGVTYGSKHVENLNAGSGWLDNSTTSVSLPPGTYIIVGQVAFSGNASGKRAVAIYNATGDSTGTQMNVMPTNTNALSVVVTDIVKITGTTNQTYKLRYSQSSGSTLKVSCLLRYVKVC